MYYLAPNQWTREELYVLQTNYACMSIQEIQALLPRRDRQAIRTKAWKLGIRKLGVYTKPYAPTKGITKDWLIENYVEKEFSMGKCGELLSLSPTTILKAIKFYGITPRKVTEKAHAVARQRIKQGDWALLKVDNRGDKNPAKNPSSREKIRLSKIGEKNAMWLGGVSFEPYCPKFNKDLKEAVRERFDRQCLVCGRKESGRHHSVHHVDYNKLQGCKGQPWALVPLCSHCHGKTSRNRWYWFSRLIHYWAMNPEINFNF